MVQVGRARLPPSRGQRLGGSLALPKLYHYSISQISTALQGEAGITGEITPAGYLQLHLAYAKAVSDGDESLAQQMLSRLARPTVSDSGEGETESPLEEEVREEVEHMGYKVASQLGDSGFRIDMAVRHPDPARGFVLGIECDGAAYHSDRSARARDVWRQEILESCGWNIHRIWSARWWYHKAEEVQKLRRALESALNRQ